MDSAGLNSKHVVKSGGIYNDSATMNRNSMK